MQLKKIISLFLLIAIVIASIGFITAFAYITNTYTVQSGDSLWKVSAKFNISINDLKLINNLTVNEIYVGQTLKTALDAHSYTVRAGDSLWSIANSYKMAVADLKSLNALTGDSIYVGQTLKTMPDTLTYKVNSGDSLYKIALKYSVAVEDIFNINSLKTVELYIGQKLLIPYKLNPTENIVNNNHPEAVFGWPSVTYIVKAGDYFGSIANKFGTTQELLMKYNYKTANDWLNEGQKIAINGYAPRNFAVMPGDDTMPTRYGHLVDWFLDGQYLIKRNDILSVTDLQTGRVAKLKVMGGFNHADLEPLTANDTAILKQLWPQWSWTPRPVVIYKDGMNIAASLSGMPHSFDTIADNNVEGHFDCYLLNSKPHSADTSQAYVEQHYDNIYIAAGK